MTTITKRDLADIALLISGFWVLERGLASVQWPLFRAETPILVGYIVALLALVYVLIFKRPWLLDRLICDGADRELHLGANAVVLAHPGFWIALFGTIVALKHGMLFVSRLPFVLMYKQSATAWSVWQSLLILLVALAMVLFSRQIGEWSKRSTRLNAQSDLSNDHDV